MSSFVKKTLKKAHGTLVERLVQKSRLASAAAAAPTNPIRGPGLAVATGHNHHHRATSSIHSSSGGAHSNRSSSNHSPYPTAPSQYAPPYQPQPQPQPPRAASGSPLYGRTTATTPPGSSASYGQSHGHRHSPAPSTGSNGFVPEPLRVNRARGSSGQYGQYGQPYNQNQGQGQQGQQHQQQHQQGQNGAWANEKYARDPFTAELEG